MSSTYNYLGIELMATGENAGTWGTKTNTNLDIIQQASTGFHSQSLNLVASGANTTVLAVANGDSSSTTDSLTNSARNNIIKLTGAITGNKIVTVPNTVNSVNFERLYLFENGTTGAYTVEIRTASGATQTGATFSTTNKGMKLMYCDGTQVYDTGFGEGDVTLNGVETLTNKTLTSPVISSIVSISNGDIDLAPNGTGHATVKGNTNGGTLQLNCTSNSHGVKIQSPAHSAGQDYTLIFPTGNVTAGRFLKVESVTGSGATGVGQLSFSEVSGGTAWQAVSTAATIGVTAGNGYFLNSTSNAITATLPASPTIGDEISFVDYAGTFDTNNLTVGRNSKNIQGAAADLTVATERAAFTLVFTDNTQGWLLKNK